MHDPYSTRWWMTRHLFLARLARSCLNHQPCLLNVYKPIFVNPTFISFIVLVVYYSFYYACSGLRWSWTTQWNNKNERNYRNTTHPYEDAFNNNTFIIERRHHGRVCRCPACYNMSESCCFRSQNALVLENTNSLITCVSINNIFYF